MGIRQRKAVKVEKIEQNISGQYKMIAPAQEYEIVEKAKEVKKLLEKDIDVIGRVVRTYTKNPNIRIYPCFAETSSTDAERNIYIKIPDDIVISEGGLGEITKRELRTHLYHEMGHFLWKLQYSEDVPHIISNMFDDARIEKRLYDELPGVKHYFGETIRNFLLKNPNYGNEGSRLLLAIRLASNGYVDTSFAKELASDNLDLYEEGLKLLEDDYLKRNDEEFLNDVKKWYSEAEKRGLFQYQEGEKGSGKGKAKKPSKEGLKGAGGKGDKEDIDKTTIEEIVEFLNGKSDSKLPDDLREKINELLKQSVDVNEDYSYFDGNMFKVVREYIKETGDTLDLKSRSQGVAIPLRKKFLDILSENVRRSWKTGYKEGPVLDVQELIKIKTNPGRGRKRGPFKKREIPKKRRYAIDIVIDESGSMRGERGDTAIASAYAIGHALDGLSSGVKYSISSYNNAEVGEANIKIYKKFNERFSPLVAGRLGTYCPDGGTPEAVVLGDEVKRIRKETAQQDRKIVIVLTDGNPEPGTEAQKEIVRNIQKKNPDVTFVGIGIQHEGVKKYYKRGVSIDDVNDLPKVLVQEILKSIED